MSSPAGIAGIVVSVVIGTPLVAIVLFLTSYFVYKFIRKHPSLLRNLSHRGKPPARNSIKEEPSILPTKPTFPGLNFDNAAFLNAMSDTSRELDPDQQSQSHTQHTILSYLSRDYTADDPPRTQTSEQIDTETRHNDQVILIGYGYIIFNTFTIHICCNNDTMEFTHEAFQILRHAHVGEDDAD